LIIGTVLVKVSLELNYSHTNIEASILITRLQTFSLARPSSSTEYIQNFLKSLIFCSFNLSPRTIMYA